MEGLFSSVPVSRTDESGNITGPKYDGNQEVKSFISPIIVLMLMQNSAVLCDACCMWSRLS